MTKKLGWSLLAAVLVFGATQLVSAQDQTPPSGDQNAPAAAPAAPAKHHGGMMEACKDDMAANCADQKGKALHKCMDEAAKAGKLSQGCMDARAKMMKHHHMHKKAAAPAAPSEQPATTTPAPTSSGQ